MNYLGERSTDPLTLLLYSAEGAGESVLYEDIVNGFGYEDGEYAHRRMVCVVSGESISVHFAEREGSFLPERNLVHIELRGMSTRPSNVLVHGEEVSWSYEEADGKL